MRAVPGPFDGLVDEQVRALCAGEALSGRSGHAATVALYLQFLKRVSAHLKNVATSVVNPYPSD